MRRIDRIIIHHSATDPDVNVEQIRRFHVDVRKWSDIGYHYLITATSEDTGTAEDGRPVERIGAHCLNHNANSIGVCVVGDYTKGPMGARRWGVLVATVRGLLWTYGLPVERVYAHRELSPTLCPGFDVEDLRKALRATGGP